MGFYEELLDRKLIKKLAIDENFLSALQNRRPVYLGIDPTAPSLHLGNYLGITLLKRFIDRGHEAIVILGETTALIGDPSFRTNERVILSPERIKQNLKAIEKQLKKLIPEAKIISNHKFYKNTNILTFVNEIFSNLNFKWLSELEFVKTRKDDGLTLAEFVYPTFQSFDFLKLYTEHGVAVQLGGSDQWANIAAGINLIRKKIGPKHVACGMTFDLLSDNLGRKFGKSERSALFLSEKLTSPYKIYQYLLNLNDWLVDDLLRKLTFLNLGTIDSLIDPIQKKNTLAYEICKDIHGKDCAERCKIVSNKLFAGELETEDFELIKDAIPTYPTSRPIIYGDVLKELSLVESNSEINRLVKDKGLFLFNELVTDTNQMLTKENSREGYYLIRKGKKTFGLVCFY